MLQQVIVNEKNKSWLMTTVFQANSKNRKNTYAIPGKPLLMSTIMFTIEPPLSPIHNLKAKQPHMTRNILQCKIDNYMAMTKSIQLAKNSPNINHATLHIFLLAVLKNWQSVIEFGRKHESYKYDLLHLGKSCTAWIN